MRYTQVSSSNAIYRLGQKRSHNGSLHDNDVASHSKKGSGQPGRRYLGAAVVLSILFLGYIAISNDVKPVRMGKSAIDTLAFSFNFQKPFYVVVIDAGSTASRVIAFNFHESILNGKPILDGELFHQIKPGLSSFADKPSEGAKTLQALLEKAKTVVPKSEWSRTPLVMKATAGLRLLPDHKANSLLKECRQLFETSGFLVTKNSVSIMEGTDEGIFSWFTVNYLLDKLGSHSSEETVAALDLGGGSTQITFAPAEEHIKREKRHIYSINAFSHNMSVYTHSYLGMGLMAARKEILTYNISQEELNNHDLVEVRSECVNPIVSTEWNYGGHNYLVKGPINGMHKIVKTQNFAGTDEDRPVVRFPECLKIVKSYIEKIKEKPLNLKSHDIYAFSYYFDRATEVGFIDPFSGGIITPDAFLKAAMDTCDYPNTDQPFMCLDLTFIYVLLRDGFHLEPTTKLNLYKKINGHEISWALGAAFNVLQNGL
ncbi:ectonucleoside triphosphate diphosphohydrolase 5 isoform X2 [Orussus abietinus]|uniref:ectonucleoside triphosphate diphosphohydrolase 5 isoform X2 n=1 Tax=Orussus abietinus TaxID=222816 RepID=UPI000625AEC2|nr:ectonucleoside triphosphate diphosphohydrolase 5 isoform X2 [Orussus abietinus]